MNGIEKLIEIIRQEGAKNNPPMIKLGEMISENSCRIGENELDAEDLYFAEHMIEHEKLIDIEEGGKLDATTDTSGNHSHMLQTLTSEGTKIRIHTTLKKGDLVAVYRISDEKYLILAKVVSGDVSV